MRPPTAIPPELNAALKRVAASYLPAGPERDDLAQEIALALHLALPQFRGESSLRTFALRIAHNVALRHVTRQRARDRRETAEDLERADAAPGPEARLSEKRSSERLLRAVRALPLSLRAVITLALEELSGPEISQVLGISENAVHIRLHRARAQLRASLEAT